MNLLAVISVQWNEKFSSSLVLSQDFYSTTIAEGTCYLLKRSCSPGRPMGSQKLGSWTWYFRMQLSEKAEQFHQQKSDSNEAHSTFSCGFLS